MLITARKTVAALAVGVAAASQVVLVAPAAVAEEAPLIEVQRSAHNVFFSGDTATASAKYRCSPDVVATHVWVGLKQGGEDLEGHGSSQRAASYYDTNASFGGVEPLLTCDGEWQHLTVQLARNEGKQALQVGEAWLQFCMYATDGEAMAGDSDNRWAPVKTRGRQ